MASERLSGDERELLYAIAQQATALAGGTMNTEAHDERELLAEIELQLRTLVEGGVPSGSCLSAGQVPQWNGSQFVGLFVDSWDFNFTANGDGYFYARVAMTVNLAGTAIGTGTLSYAKSTNAAPSTFSATTLPATLEAGAYFRVTVAGLSGFKALQIVRTA